MLNLFYSVPTPRKGDKKVVIFKEDRDHEEIARQSDDTCSEANSLPTITEDSRYEENITASTSTISESTLVSGAKILSKR